VSAPSEQTPEPEPALGLARTGLRLVPYDPRWPELFVRERALLQAAVGKWVLDIQHVGSTALPGMTAKPILDIGIAVADWERAKVCIAPIEGLGYQYRGENGIPRRHYFVKGTAECRTHHIHMVEMASEDWQTLVLFRDYLAAHPQAAEEYRHLKLSLAEAPEVDRQAYQDGKAAFILRTIQRAREGLSADEG
jgi:GrpB-like predicted nucleotidyltransferase (UPF0157 family)